MSLNTLRRSAVTLAIVIMSVVLVTAGTATAARLITGKDIKNGSITGKDIKNKSVGAGDLSPGAKKSLKGPAGPAGPAGGATGPAGPAVLTNVYSASEPLEGLAEDVSEVVLDKILPAGKPYLFTAKLTLSAVGTGIHVCELRSGPDVIDTARVKTANTFSLNTVMLTGVTASSGLARLSCEVTGGPGAVQQVQLIAIPVASIG